MESKKHAKKLFAGFEKRLHWKVNESAVIFIIIALSSTSPSLSRQKYIFLGSLEYPAETRMATQVFAVEREREEKVRGSLENCHFPFQK